MACSLYAQFQMNENNCVILNWNVRGLNAGARRQVVRDLVADHHAQVVCLQETKLQAVNDFTITETLGSHFVGGYAILPAEGTCGGVILACSVLDYIMEDIRVGKYMVSATVKSRVNGITYSITGVYGPQSDSEEEEFLIEMQAVRPLLLPKWVILGDFNLIYRATQKNNGRVNFRLINRFKQALDALDLRELKLQGRRFTWSSGTDDPTLTKIDHLFYTEQWELDHPNCYFQALSSSMSDHCPLLLTHLPNTRGRTGFRFESYSAQLPNFIDVVQQTWAKEVRSNDQVRVLHIKLSRLAKALKKWSKTHVMALKLKAEIATEVVALLEQAQERRLLTAAELSLRKLAKARILGFTALRRIKIRQQSRLTWIKLGDANTRLFHLRANSRRRKNFIASLSTPTGTVTSHQDKALQLLHYYTSLLGTSSARHTMLNWEQLQIQRHDLSQLDEPINEEEVRKAIFEAPPKKAPGPDGYTGLFYKLTWDIIKEDLMQALKQLYELRGNTCSLVNSANVTLLPKREDALTPADYRPISLVHSVAKILTKVLANRLAPHLPKIVSPSQSAFIKGRSIQDNFQYIQGAINHFHRSKTPMIFLKLDIAKAFDSVRWEYMLEVMQHLGFGQRWRDLICLLWANTSSRILLNGIPGRPIKHRRGLRQGDPLSPMLIILTMDPLQKLLDRATDHGLLSPVGADPIKMRISLYADDAALFVRPTVQDLTNV
jgi:exonuclease III